MSGGGRRMMGIRTHNKIGVYKECIMGFIK